MGIKVVDGRSIAFKPLEGPLPPAVDSVGTVFTSKDSPNHGLILERVWDCHLEDFAELDEILPSAKVRLQF